MRKKTFIRALAVILALCAALPLIVGCNKGGNTDETTAGGTSAGDTTAGGASSDETTADVNNGLTPGDALAIASPSGENKIEFNADSNGQYLYTVTAGETVVIEASMIGMEIENGFLETGLSVVDGSVKKQELKETYTTFVGPTREKQSHCNELRFTLKTTTEALTLSSALSTTASRINTRTSRSATATRSL